MACSSDTPRPDGGYDGGLEEGVIGFGAKSGEEMKDSRGVVDPVDNDKFLQAGKFLVYSNYDYDMVNGSYVHSVPEFQKQEVTYDAPTQKWTYSPKRFWSGTGAYHFRACFPTTADIISSSNGKNLAIDYSIYKDSYDLMVAYHYRDMATTPDADKAKPVNLIFNHALAAIRFKMIAETGKEYQLSGASIYNLYTVATFSYNLGVNSDQATVDPQWNEKLLKNWQLAYWDSNKNPYGYTGKPTDLITDDTAKETYISPYMYVIPQEVNKWTKKPTDMNDKREYTAITFTIQVNGQHVTTVKELPEFTWYPGKKYTYLIKVKPGMQTTIEVVTTDWEAVDATGDDIIIDK